MADTWPQWLSSSKHVAEACDWVRWKTQGKAKVVIAIGAHSVSVAKNRDLDPEDAVAILEETQQSIAAALRALGNTTHTTMRLPER